MYYKGEKLEQIKEDAFYEALEECGMDKIKQFQDHLKMMIKATRTKKNVDFLTDILVKFNKIFEVKE